MSDYTDKHVNEIMADKELEFPKNMAMSCAWVLGHFKGLNLRVLDVRHLSSLCDFFIMGSATNMTQASAMAEELIKQLKRHKQTIVSKEGLKNTDWILIDTGDVIVHIFLETSRTVYNLEQLWKEAKPVKIPHSYYTSADEGQDQDTKGYF